MFVIQYIRVNNLCLPDISIKIGTDNGVEFFSGSKRKGAVWNQSLSEFNASIFAYNPGFDVRKNLIERSHKTDDEEFLIPAGFSFTDHQNFMKKAQEYSNYFNFQRAHSGIEMHNRTPFEVIKDANITNPQKLFNFPTLYLDHAINDLKEIYKPILAKLSIEKLQPPLSQMQIRDLQNSFHFLKRGSNVLTYYQNN